MGKEVKFDLDARNGLQAGLDILANAVKITLGPKGRHAAIERRFGAPLVTKDGVTVAKSISLDGKLENMGAQLVKAVASATNFVAGDGTTTATVLAQSIYTEGAKMVAAGHNPVLIKRGIDKAVKVVVNKLQDISIPVSDEQVIKNVAIISSNNDIELGKIIGEVISNIGNDGTISVEDAPGTETNVQYTEGLTLDRGYITPTFATNLEKLTVEFDSPYILCYDGAITSSYDILPMLELVSKDGRALLIIARNVESEALQTLVLNKARGALNVCAVKAPGFGDIRRDLLGDIAAVCGARFFSENELQSLKDISTEDLGVARRVVVTRGQTTIVDGAGTEDATELRVSGIRNQLQDPGLHAYEIASLKQRLATLSGSIAVFRVGGISETEMKERKDRVEDAINAVKAAIEEGIVPGGGAALLHCVKSLNSLKNDSSLIVEEKVGVEIVSKAIKAPFVQILKNAGTDHYSYMEKIINSKETLSGYDAYKNEFVKDMFEVGIIDPAKVVRTALENAASASGTLLTTEVAIHELDVLSKE